MPAESRRGAANVDRHVEDPAARATHELILREWRRLEVQAAQGADRGRIGMVVLHEGEFKAGVLPVEAVIDLGKKPTCVAVFLWRHDLDRRNCGLFHLHCGPPSCRPTGSGAALLPEAAAPGHPQICVTLGAVSRRKHRGLVGRSAKKIDIFLTNGLARATVFQNESGRLMAYVL